MLYWFEVKEYLFHAIAGGFGDGITIKAGEYIQTIIICNIFAPIAGHIVTKFAVNQCKRYVNNILEGISNNPQHFIYRGAGGRYPTTKPEQAWRFYIAALPPYRASAVISSCDYIELLII